MLAQQRHNAIMAQVHARGTVQVQDLAESLDVSTMTIRRDLAELDELGVLTRVHGGATLVTSAHEPQFAEKMAINADAKTAIARAALNLVHSSQSIGIAGGSTCTKIAQEITAQPELTDITVVTNSLQVLNILHADLKPGIKTLLTGGERTPSDAFVGPIADAALSTLSTDILFMGAHGSGEKGLFTPNLHEGHTNQVFMKSAREVVAVFDATKWSVTGLMRFAQWRDIDTVITSNTITDEQHRVLTDNVNKVVVA